MRIVVAVEQRVTALNRLWNGPHVTRQRDVGKNYQTFQLDLVQRVYSKPIRVKMQAIQAQRLNIVTNFQVRKF